jgi:Xaa-Pro dipeptidase
MWISARVSVSSGSNVLPVGVSIDAMAPGVKAQEIAKICNRKLEEFGYPLLEGTKRVGHGLGLDFQEPPSLNVVEEQELVPGTVLTPEPRFVHDNEWIMVEEDVVITDDGVRRLSPDRYDILQHIEV